MKRHSKVFLLSFSASTVATALALTFLRHHVARTAAPLLRTARTVRSAPVGIIFGAFVSPDGTPCQVLQDRLDTGHLLYTQGTVSKLILSGDHGQKDYDEVNAMRRYLQEKGVPPCDLFLDHAGFDTYDTLYRARDIFGVTKAVLVTQTFHLKRALFIGRALGIEVQGVASDLSRIHQIEKLQRREVIANVKAALDLVRSRKPVYLGKFISLDSDGRVTHDKDSAESDNF